MNNDELKKKIKEILRKRMTELLGSCHTDEIPLTEEGAEAILFYADEFADALIAAGLKFDTVVSHTATFDIMQQEQISRLEIRVAEAEYRAEVAEMALKSRAMCHVLKYFPNEISGLKSCIQEVYEAWIYQAEKELAEGAK